MRKVISMNYGSSTSSWKPWRQVRLGGIYTSVPTWTHLQNSLAAPEVLSLKISFPRNISQMITKTIPISTRIVISYAMKWGIPLWIWWKVNGNWDNKMIRISQWKESHCRTNTSIRREKKIQKSRTVRVTVWDPSRKVNHLSKVVWDHQVYQFHQNKLASTYDEC